METSRNILLPLDISADNGPAFVFAVEYAQRSNATLILLAGYEPEKNEDARDAVYHHLLLLSGFYQSMVNGWKNPLPVAIKKRVMPGNLQELIHQVVLQDDPDAVVLPSGNILKKTQISQVLTSLQPFISAPPAATTFDQNRPELPAQLELYSGHLLFAKLERLRNT